MKTVGVIKLSMKIVTHRHTDRRTTDSIGPPYYKSPLLSQWRLKKTIEDFLFFCWNKNYMPEWRVINYVGSMLDAWVILHIYEICKNFENNCGHYWTVKLTNSWSIWFLSCVNQNMHVYFQDGINIQHSFVSMFDLVCEIIMIPM